MENWLMLGALILPFSLLCVLMKTFRSFKSPRGITFKDGKFVEFY